MSIDRLFFVAPDAITVSALWSWPDGWSVNVWSHESGTGEPSARPARYERLTSSELEQVVIEELSKRLGNG